MRSLMLLLAIGLAATEKLDRTYLPPPGSKFSGGSVGDLQVPLEYPKETYSTTAPFTPGHNGRISPGDTGLTEGTDRGIGLPRIPGQSKDLTPVIPTNQPGNYFNKVPVTTTSYAFTQTTTFPTTEGFDTTISPIGQGYSEGSLSESGLVNNPHLNQGQVYPANQAQPGLNQPENQILQGLVPTPGSNIPGSQQILPGGQNVFEGYSYQPQNQYQHGLPSSTISPLQGSSILPGLPSSPQNQYSYNQHLGVQPPRQFVQQGFPSTTAAPSYQTGIPSHTASFSPEGTIPGLLPTQQPGQRPISAEYGNLNPTLGPQTGTTQYIDNYGNVQTVPTPATTLIQQPTGPQFHQQGTLVQPGTILNSGDLHSIQGTAIPNLSELGGQRPLFGGQQGPLSSVVPSQSTTFGQGPIPGISQGNFIPGSTIPQSGSQSPLLTQQTITPGSTIPQSGSQSPLPGQQSIYPSNLTPQGYPTNYQSGGHIQPGQINQQGLLIPGSTVDPALGNQQPILSPYGQGQVVDGRAPSNQPNINTPGSSQYNYRPDSPTSTSVYPGFNQPSSSSVSLPTQSTISSINNQLRPQRPQAESDRNAIILNYENVMTPEGFYYSFDTSNGIHADEIGTAIDGVKANGSYSYVGDDGKLYSVHYSADENGFRPHGDHLPTPPPIPEAIQRIIEHAAKEKEAGISHDGSYDEDKYGHKKYQRPKHGRPLIQDRIIANGADIPDDYESSFSGKNDKKTPGHQGVKKPISSSATDDSSEYEDEIIDSEGDLDSLDKNKKAGKINRPLQTHPSRRPFNNKPYEIGYERDDEDNEYSPENYEQQPKKQSTYNRKGSNRKDGSNTRRPVKPSRKGKPASSQDGYENGELLPGTEDIENESGERYHEGDGIPSKATGNEYNDSDDDSQDLPDNFDSRDKKTDNKLKGNQNLPGSRTKGNKMIGQRKPLRGPSKSVGNKYLVSDDNAEDYYEESVAREGQDQRIRERPQKGSKRPINARNKLKNKPQPKTYTFDNQHFASGGNMKYDQNNERPLLSRPNEEEENYKYPEQKVNEETGYQYTPPQYEFKQGNDKFPSRFSDKVQGFSTKKASTRPETTDINTTAKPFITPNVYRQDDESYEEQSEERLPASKPGKTSTKVTQKPSDSYDSYETSDDSEYLDENDFVKDIEDEVSSKTKTRPSKPTSGSNRRPSFSVQQTTGRPQYNDQYSPNNRKTISQKGSSKPERKGDRYPANSYQEPKGRRPAGQSLVSSTTPTPVKYSMQGGSKRPQVYYQQEKGQTVYPSTSQPFDTSSTEEDYDKTTTSEYSFTDADSSRPLNKPGISDTYSVTSTTRPGSTRIPSSRPTSNSDLEYTDQSTLPGSTTIKPGTFGPSYNRPSTGSEVYSTRIPGLVTIKPGNTVNQFVRPTTQTQSGAVTFTPGSSTSGRNEYPENNLPGSLPTRPSSIATLPGQSRVTENLPSTTYRPNYSVTSNQPSSVSVDAFGRPSQPGFETTKISGSLFSPVQETGLPSTAVYQNSGINSERPSIVPTFKPSEARFGQPEYNTQVIPGQAPGQKPLEFGPSGVNVPEYLGPYTSSTERVIGENFSGPRQHQRFDPVNGYYY